jgi:hypothetical protein
MNEQPFRDYLLKLGLDQDAIDSQVAFIQDLEKYLQENALGLSLEDLNHASTQAVVDGMIDRGENSIENLLAIARYAKMSENQAMFVCVFQMLDGYEVMDNLYQKMADMAGEELRDVIFEDMSLPPLGLSRREKAQYTSRIMTRLEEIFEENICRDLLKDSLRHLPDEYYLEDKKDYWETCDGDIDKYLNLKGQKFLDTLKNCQEKGELFFGQEITDEVIAFVDDNPEIGGGVREGNIIYETKIPYNTKAFLAETDPAKKRYHYCHCPWAKETINNDTIAVSPIFCQCSAGFHKRAYEVIFGQSLQAEVLESILNGDPVCRFAIHLPDQEE